jgi:demethylmenaquinone methyltransferase/2-methoxy-6-polyprenyl-1,4-benzoquinol methylase
MNMSEYSLVADTYDFLLAPFLRGLRMRILNTVIELNPGSIVDLCCGTGNQLKRLSLHGFKNLTCVDLAEDMLRVAQRGAHSPDCLHANAADTGLPSASVDAVIISLALHEKLHSDAAAVLKEAHRLLRPGGNLIVSDFNTGESLPFLVGKAVKLIESIAGGEHFKNYKSYVKNGGLPVLYDKELFSIEDQSLVAAGAILVEVCKKVA